MCRIHNKSSNYTPNTNPPVTSHRQLRNWSKDSKKATSSRPCWVSQVPVRPSPWRTSSPVSTSQLLVLAHNKTLAAQLYGEFKEFFPENAVEYFVSYYDYYQPEAYVPSSDTYIAKDSSINDEIDKLRLSATASLVRAEGCHYCGKCFLYLRSGQPGGLQGSGAVSYGRGRNATGTMCCAS